MAGHYVDDTGAVDAGPIAQGRFEAYERLCKLLRIRLKKSKRQTPTAVRDALGAVIALPPEAAQVKPTSQENAMQGQKVDSLSPNAPRGLRRSSISTIQRYSAISARQR